LTQNQSSYVLTTCEHSAQLTACYLAMKYDQKYPTKTPQ